MSFTISGQTLYVNLLGILISGGQGFLGYTASAEVFIPALNKSCSLPSLTNSRHEHSQNNLLACGGQGTTGTETTCEGFTSGVGWRQEPYILTEERRYHTSWSLSNGSLLLLGGEWSNTTEVVIPGVGTRPGFSLKYPI